MEKFLQERNAEANSILKADETLTEADKKIAGKAAATNSRNVSQTEQSSDFQPIRINCHTQANRT